MSSQSTSLSPVEMNAIFNTVRAWMHEQPWSPCGPGTDTCPLSAQADELSDRIVLAVEGARHAT